ncbi:MAG TPA: DUF1592 domain-containing protein [Polyangiaceae bacterium]|nr:DUF1592 domain-containing protein [Polyangiaceae bacterium]
MRLELGIATVFGLRGLAVLALAGGTLAAGCSAGGGAPAGGPGTGGTSGVQPGAGAGNTPMITPLPGGGDVGTKVIHRLSNVEYGRTVHDLLGTNLNPATDFTLEEVALGFNTVADAMTMSPKQVSDYYDAAMVLADELFNDATRSAAFITCQPAAAGDTACAATLIKGFGLKAYRRPLEQWEVDDLVSRYTAALTAGEDHKGALKHVVGIMLSSPQFLYRMEIDADPLTQTPRALNGYELASRLSYLLWSSMPDTALLDAAAKNELSTPEGIAAQLQRMLAEPHSSALVSNFSSQWFGANHLTTHEVDTTLFPAWNDNLRVAMQNEMGAYFDEFLHGARPYSDFLSADVKFVDSGLAGLYGVNAPGSGQMRVEGATPQRPGFLGLAGFLTFTSRKNRTAPAVRAKWVLDSLMCSQLNPPDNLVIPPLTDPPPGQSLRETVLAHSTNPACAGCHKLMDPIGLGFENFDAIGKYRATYADGSAVDASGTMPDGTPFKNFTELAAIVKANPGLGRCAAQKLFVYGMGRTVTPSEAYLDQIVADWGKTSGTLADLLKQLVLSDVFRFRKGAAQ